MVGAVVLGAGTPAFSAPYDSSALRLLDVQSGADNSNVVVRYAITAPGRTK